MKEEPKIYAMRGRAKENHKSRVSGLDTEQVLEPNITNTISTVQKDNLVVYVKSNTKKGYEEAEPFDTINFSNSNSKTRRGRVGKGVAQTLDTGSNQAVVVPKNGHRIRRLTEIEAERLQGFEDNHTEHGIYPEENKSQEQINKMSNKELIKHFSAGKKKKIPATQRYKLLGNAVMVDCVEAIARKIEFED